MKIKQTTFYAVRAINRIYLENGSVVTSNVIAEKEGVSQGVLIRLLRMLNQAGIVNAHQGRGAICGGFSLAKNIDEITLLDVVEVTEGVDICINFDSKVQEDDSELLRKCSQINDQIKKEFSRYTIRDLFEL